MYAPDDDDPDAEYISSWQPLWLVSFRAWWRRMNDGYLLGETQAKWLADGIPWYWRKAMWIRAECAKAPGETAAITIIIVVIIWIWIGLLISQ